MPSRKEIQWSQLRVGGLVLAATAILIGLIFLMSGSTGGLFTSKLVLRSYFKNAAGLKNGAPVTLEDVTIGNVSKIRIVPDRNPTPVEVTMELGREYVKLLHTDSTATIAQAGVLGDSYVDLSSESATGPNPPNNAELKTEGAPSIQDVIRSGDVSMQQLTELMRKVGLTIDAVNSSRGTAGLFVNDPELYRKFNRIASDLETITGNLAAGKGSLGKFMTDESLYTRANSAVDRLDKITADLDDGKGTAGKFLKDDSLYNNMNSAVANANQLVAEINAGKGSLGKLAKDPDFAKKLDDTVTRLDTIITGVEQGKGSVGQLFQNRSLYDHADQTLDQAHQLLKGMREDPKKYFVIRLKMF